MTLAGLATILGWLKEAAIVGALGWVVWFLYHSGEDRVKVQQLEAVTKQIAQNAKQAQEAQQHVQSDIQSLHDAISQQRTPVIVRVPGPVRDAPKAANSPAPSGGTDQGPGIDVRPQINAFEEKYERALAQCRGVLEAWPK